VNLQGPVWRKSSRSSGGGNGDCVEVATEDGVVAVRDSKAPEGDILVFGAPSWTRFLGSVRTGRVDSGS
jgi:hypothetical protein